MSDPPGGDRGLARYSTRAVELLGRDGAFARLQAFVLSAPGFAWIQVAGVGGQGKSRLGYELTLWARDRGWQAGLLETTDLKAFNAHWSDWQPSRPHLLVLDYVVGRESDIKIVIQTLASRADRLRHPVRLLFLERQRWDRGGLGGLKRTGESDSGQGSEGRAEWFLALSERFDGNDPYLESTRFEDGVLELKQLDDADLIAIVRRMGTLTGNEIALSDATIAERLRHIDSAGRPLYAYFLGQALAARHDLSRNGVAGPGWSREDLLDATLDREQGSRWRHVWGDAVPDLGDGGPAERLAVIATIAGGLDCRTAEQHGLIPHVDSRTRRQALILTGGALGGSASSPSQRIPSLQPDLLGEWFVLRAFRQGLPLHAAMDPAWRWDPAQTAAFLSRLSQDFPDEAVTDELLRRELPDAASSTALANVASAILVNLYRAHRPFPKAVIDALTHAANSGDARAMNGIGYCHYEGKGVERDVERALAWYCKAADAGDGAAMANLGFCYQHGHGVERDLTQALAWYRKGAEAGSGTAMTNLGFCFQNGLGVERDSKQALAWYRKGAEEGSSEAMANLGVCYQNGNGVEQDLEQALAWYRKGASTGSTTAMSNLGVCYEQGQGVEPDLTQALSWYGMSARAGGTEAMHNLGRCYYHGQGVEQDLEEAAAWYRKAAEAGSREAMTDLGTCYEKGKGVEPDLDQALAWYRKSAEAGSGRAMVTLGFHYLSGRGVERDVTQAAAWYRKGVEAGSAVAAVQLRNVSAGLALLEWTGGSDPAVEPLTADRQKAARAVAWLDAPLIPADWQELYDAEAASVLARLAPRLHEALPGVDVDSFAMQRVRRAALPFYPGLHLVDVQVQRPEHQRGELLSALASPTAVALLDGSSPLLSTVNAHRIALRDEAASSAYLRFYCMFVRGDDGPFQIVEELDALPVEASERDALPPAVREAVRPLRMIDRGDADHRRRRFAACVLYADELFSATFAVSNEGSVHLEDGERIADHLSIRRRHYDGIFRTALQDVGES